MWTSWTPAALASARNCLPKSQRQGRLGSGHRRGRSRREEVLVLAVRGQRLQRLDDGLRDRHVSLMAGFRADKRRVGRILQVDSIPPQREALALPHRRRAGERQERTHLSITFGLVPERPELNWRHDAIT